MIGPNANTVFLFARYVFQPKEAWKLNEKESVTSN